MMAKLLGLDLGTNSIGWAIRDTDEEENQIIDYGVIVFEKGVGDGKSGEFSLAAERRKNRSKRRLYNAKRYRKWATLKVLMKSEMCPISEEELKLWRIGDWKDYGKNKGRVYPSSPDFRAWLAMDFDRIGNNISQEIKLKPAYENTYLFRCELLKLIDEKDKLRKYKIGRAIYHLAQRRGFRTSRKSGKSNYGTNEYLEEIRKEQPELFAVEILQNGLQQNNRRIRNSGVLQRIEYEKEFRAICEKQKLSPELANELHRAIYYVRPLRTQKGLVGKCTLEKGKPRIPISHPAFEEFRALQFINNIQWRERGSKKEFESIPMELKKKILKELFFKRIEKGKNKGQVSDRTFFKFDELINSYSENGKWEFNYRNRPSVSTCPVIACLMNVFDEEWENKFITDGNKFGINWDTLLVTYSVKYGKKAGKKIKLNYEGIWHLLFDYLQTKDKEDDLKKFCKNVLEWGDEKTELFTAIDIQQGYGSLSRSAINKALPFLQEGFIYSEAVSFANLSKVLGKENFLARKEAVTKSIAKTIKEVNVVKERLSIVNGLIQQYFSEVNSTRAKGVDERLKQEAEADVEKKLRGYFGEDIWNEKTIIEQKEYFDFVLHKYLAFLDGNQSNDEKASVSKNKTDRIDYYKLPRLDEIIKQTLKEEYKATDDGLKHLYHPSDIDIYPKVKGSRLIDPQPPSKGWKNPMAMRTMYELRKLLQYLIDREKIDRGTKVIVEMARELNDANRRWAIQKYQNDREAENIEFAKAIIGVAKEKYPNLNEQDADNIDKVRLWWEQLENGEDIYKHITSLKEDVQKYRLWKEQQCQCMYTGKMFSMTDLFDGTKTQFEHTLPLSDSFDNSLANLTVCSADYNMRIKKDQFPTQLPNYKMEQGGYSPIEPRLKKWIEKRDSLKERIENNKIETKKAIRRSDVERKDYLIRQRHLLQFDFDYWDKKVKTFTLTDLPDWWKNSQLVDTQIISKYARAYLKSYFNKVDVQKGSIVSEFRKIYGIMGNEKKDRSRHSHHAIDAAVLTLIPGSARREDILKRYYKALETYNNSFHEVPYPGFNIAHITSIAKTVLINHVSKDQTLTRTKKKVRKRGKVQFVVNKDGERVPMIMKGDSIRGQLHKETFFGAIKVPLRNEKGFAVKEDGKYLVQTNKKTGEEEIWIVSRKPLSEINIEKDKIIDELLKVHIQNQLNNGSIKSITDAKDFNGKQIRHLRCAFKAGRGFLTKEKAIELKKHTHLSKKEHKKYVLAQNSQEGNYLYLLYEDKETKTRAARIVTLIDVSSRSFPGIKGLYYDNGYNTFNELPLRQIITRGQRTIFFSDSKSELQELDSIELNKRIFVVYKFNESGTPDIYLKNSIVANPNPEIDKLCENSFEHNKFQYGLSLKVSKLSCVFEGTDFEIKPDGGIEWLF